MSSCEHCDGCEPNPCGDRAVPPRGEPLSGIINVDKPPAMTSHDVVDVVRRMAGQQKVGHAGTLDPMATGVLLVCLGQATRVAEYLMASQKRYRATIVLGSTTDTYDAEGEFLTSGGRTAFSTKEIEAGLRQFVGRIEQIPPIFSALKRNGQPLYKLARRGAVVKLKPRLVAIDEIILRDWTQPSLTIEVTCSPGTYIRSLAHDFGQYLGSGGYLAALVRLSSGRFRLEDAVSLARMAEAFRHGEEERYLVPLDEALLDWSALVVGTADARRVVQGQAIRLDSPSTGAEVSTLRRAYSVDGEFLAIVAYDPGADLWRPRKVFAR